MDIQQLQKEQKEFAESNQRHNRMQSMAMVATVYQLRNVSKGIENLTEKVDLGNQLIQQTNGILKTNKIGKDVTIVTTEERMFFYTKIYDKVIFANGGDRHNENVPEYEIFKDNDNVIFRWAVGGLNKLNSSSWILSEWENKK